MKIIDTLTSPRIVSGIKLTVAVLAAVQAYKEFVNANKKIGFKT